MPEIQGPSRGRKQCPECRNYIGVRNQKCPTPDCAHDFTTKAEPARPEKADPPIGSIMPPSHKIRTERADVKLGFNFYAIHLDKGVPGAAYIEVPAGKCPIAIKSFTEEGIREWADELAELSAEKNQHLSKEAIEYYSRRLYNYPLDSAKEQLIKKVIGLAV